MIVNLTLFALTDELIAQGAVNLEGRPLERLKLYLDPVDEFFSKSPNMTGAEIADMAFNNGRPAGWREPRPTPTQFVKAFRLKSCSPPSTRRLGGTLTRFNPALKAMSAAPWLCSQ